MSSLTFRGKASWKGFIGDLVFTAVMLTPMLYGLIAYPAISLRWFLVSFSGWGYLAMILYLLYSDLNLFLIKHLQNIVSPLDPHLHRMCLFVKALVLVNTLGYWLIVMPMTMKLSPDAFVFTNPDITVSWFQILQDFVLHTLPFLFVFYPESITYNLTQIPHESYWKGILSCVIFGVAYIMFAVGYWLNTKELCWCVEFAMSPRLAILVFLLYLLLYTICYTACYAVRMWLHRRRLNRLIIRPTDRAPLLVNNESSHSDYGSAPPAQRHKRVKTTVTTITSLLLLGALIGTTVYLSIVGMSKNDIARRYDFKGVRVSMFDSVQAAINKSGIVAQEGTSSLLLSNGNALWLSGRTTLSDGTVVPNSAMYVMVANNTIRSCTILTNKTTGAVIPFLPFNATENPDDESLVPSGSLTYNSVNYVYFELTQNKEGKLWHPSSHAIGLAISNGFSMNFTRALQPSFTTPIQPSSMLVHRDPSSGIVYVYSFFVKKPTLAASNVYLARIPVSQLADKTQSYEYWTGTSNKFSRKFPVEMSPALVEGVFGEVSVVWNHYLRTYTMLHVGLLGDWHTLYMRTASHPWGPFSAPILLHRGPEASTNPFQSKHFYYRPGLHPELTQNAGQLFYATFSVADDGSVPKLLQVSAKQK